jgi:hypothetical protein
LSRFLGRRCLLLLKIIVDGGKGEQKFELGHVFAWVWTPA